ncbi:AI-2E family transporter [Paraburkholderia youngii]|uniref:AI-2E family transporter n=1 Tax=Paraburkholderia youngii TaxID=2782701 RepID=UPI003D1ACBF5
MSIKTSRACSCVIVAALVLGILLLHLVSGAIAGLLVFMVSRRLACVLQCMRGRFTALPASGAALALVVGTVVAALLGAGAGVWHLVQGQDVAGVTAMLADTLGSMHSSVPHWIDAYLPVNVDDARLRALEFIKRYQEQLSAAGMGTLRGCAHVLIGLVVGAMIAAQRFDLPSRHLPLSAALMERIEALRLAFERVIFAQVKISVLNATLSALYLLVCLPAAGIHVPFAKTLVLITFIAGLVPVVGNLASNTMIVIASLGVSFHAAIAASVFLVVIHKLEYVANARFVGSEIKARAWEIILSIVLMESIFGLPGVIVAPILYAWVKSELSAAGLVGLKRAPGTAAEALAHVQNNTSA